MRSAWSRPSRSNAFSSAWGILDGTIAWEGMQEMLYSRERITKKPVTLQVAVERAAKGLVAAMP